MKSGYSQTIQTLAAAMVLMLHFGAVSFAQATLDERDNADTQGLNIDAIAGWDNLVDRSSPVPVSFLLQNYSNRIIEGRLTLSDPANRTEIVIGEVTLAPNSTRRFATIRSFDDDWFECFAALKSGRDVLWRRELSIATGSFEKNSNYALFIDESGRRPLFKQPKPAAVTVPVVNPFGEELRVLSEEQGRPVKNLSVTSWQLPDHPGPLMAVQSVIFPEATDARLITLQQWSALARWLCQGGHIFLHAESKAVFEELSKAAPLSYEATETNGSFRTTRIGLGTIHQYQQPMMGSAGAVVRDGMRSKIARLNKTQMLMLADSIQYTPDETGQAQVTRVYVIGFFGLFTFLSGVMSLLLMRLSKRKMAVYFTSVIVGASVSAGVLGAWLRMSPGDLTWVSVTQVGAGGAVQIARVDVQSAGSRSNQVAVKGDSPDLQFVRRSRQQNFFYGRLPARRTLPFNWQPNLIVGEEDTYQIDVPINPWGRRKMFATGFVKDMPRLDFSLKFEPSAHSDETQASSNRVIPPSGQFRLSITNNLPAGASSDAWLVVGATRWSTADFRDNYGYYNPPPVAGAGNTGRVVDIYHLEDVTLPPPGESRTMEFPASFDYEHYQQTLQLHANDDRIRLTFPEIERRGDASAWIIATLNASPNLAIDEPRTQFLPQGDAHILIQQIRPEDMPDGSLFIGNAPATPATEGDSTEIDSEGATGSSPSGGQEPTDKDDGGQGENGEADQSQPNDQ